MTPVSVGRALPAARHRLGAVEAGDWVDTGSLTVTARMIDAFADLSGDHFAIHMEDAAARSYGFPGRVAHGLLVLSLVDGLKNQAPAQFDAIASLGWDWRFSAPVLIGDTISARLTLLRKRETSRPGRGILELDVVVKNQRGEVVQEGVNRLLVKQ